MEMRFHRLIIATSAPRAATSCSAKCSRRAARSSGSTDWSSTRDIASVNDSAACSGGRLVHCVCSVWPSLIPFVYGCCVCVGDGNGLPLGDQRLVRSGGGDCRLGEVRAHGGAQLGQHGLVVGPGQRLGERQCGLLAWGVVVDVAPDDETVE